MVDVIGASSACGLFKLGHDVHYIQGLKSGNDPAGLRFGRAVVLDDGWFEVHLDDGEVLRHWNHRTDALARALKASSGRVRIGSYHVLTVPHVKDGIQHWEAYDLGDEPTPCPTADPAPIETFEDVLDRLDSAGGFSMSAAEFRRLVKERRARASVRGSHAGGPTRSTGAGGPGWQESSHGG